ncbi:MAG: HAMP domain-containing histidine kinase [Tissierellia bacterium]|nr:HAMP domain-containing histidine kinase [Tissierellia bacterium]
MKSKKNKTNTVRFNLAKKKILLIILSSSIIVLLISFILYKAIRGNTSEKIIDFIENNFVTISTDTTPSSAKDIYETLIASNMNLIVKTYIFLAFAVTLILIYIRVSRYIATLLLEVDIGLEYLEDENDINIVLRPELASIEDNINKSRELINLREEQAKLAEERKNDLVIYLAHDLKTPLTYIIGYINLIQDNPDLPTEFKMKYLNITYEKAIRLEYLINDFFEITRYNLQKVELEYETIDLNFMMIQMVEEFYPITYAYDKQIEIISSKSIEILGDSDKLARVFSNLIKNAINYSEPSSIIKININENPLEAIIEFRNTGKTIPQYKLNSIFEKFYRLDESRSTTGGSGLGLSIAKEIIELHDGKITANSNDGITTFTVLLPKSRNIKKSS